jgi:hypothetical protein
MRVALVLGCLLLATTVAAKDLVVRQRSSTTLSSGPPLGDETVYLAGDTIVTDSQATRTIVDLGKKTITTADKAKRTYSVLTFDDLRAQMETLRTALEKMPPEARKQMGALFDEGGPVTITPTGKTETIAGYPAKEHALKGGPYSGTIWTTTAIAKPPAFQKWKTVEKSRGGAARQLGEAIEKLDGFPLRTRIEAQTGGQPVTLSNEVLEVREGSPPADVLTVPSGFTKQAAGGVPSPAPNAEP